MPKRNVSLSLSFVSQTKRGKSVKYNYIHLERSPGATLDHVGHRFGREAVRGGGIWKEGNYEDILNSTVSFGTHTELDFFHI